MLPGELINEKGENAEEISPSHKVSRLKSDIKNKYMKEGKAGEGKVEPNKNRIHEESLKK